jgi:hypothetical protein
MIFIVSISDIDESNIDLPELTLRTEAILKKMQYVNMKLHIFCNIYKKKHIFNYLHENAVIFQNQSGFLPRQSTVFQLIYIYMIQFLML